MTALSFSIFQKAPSQGKGRESEREVVIFGRRDLRLWSQARALAAHAKHLCPTTYEAKMPLVSNRNNTLPDTDAWTGLSSDFASGSHVKLNRTWLAGSFDAEPHSFLDLRIYKLH